MSLVPHGPSASGLAEVLDRLIVLEPLLDGIRSKPLARGGCPLGAQDSRATIRRAAYGLERAAPRRTGRHRVHGAALALLRQTVPGDRLLLTTGLMSPRVPHGERTVLALQAAVAEVLRTLVGTRSQS